MRLIKVFLILFFIIFAGITFAEAPGIKITEPLDGSIVNPGQEIAVTVESVGGLELKEVLIVAPFSVETLTSSPFTVSLTVPNEAVGTISISATEQDASGNFTGDEITLKVQQTATLQSLEINQDEIFVHLDWDGNIKGESSDNFVTIYGFYSDGIKRILDDDPNTSYTSSDPSVISVDNKGNWQLHKVAPATITISNSGLSKVIPLVFTKPRGIRPSETIPPTTQIEIHPQANAAGWHNQDIAINITAQDNEGGSGVEEINYGLIGLTGQRGIPTETKSIPGNSAEIVISQEGIAKLIYDAVDREGNAGDSHFVDVKLDKTPPVITVNVSPQPNSSGWNNTDVKATFTASDSLSGVASVTPAIAVTTEGATQKIKSEAVDFADNKAAAYATVKLDKTPPLLSLNLEPYRMKLPFRVDNLNFFMPFFYKLNYSATDALSGLKDLKAGLVIPNINGFRTQLIKGKRLQIVLDETKKYLLIIAPDPQGILNQLKASLLLINNNQMLYLNQRPKVKIWTVNRLDKFLAIKAPSITFKAEAGDYADNSSTKQIQYLKKRIPLPEHIKPLINRRELSLEEIGELMEDAAIDQYTLKIIRKNYKIKY